MKPFAPLALDTELASLSDEVWSIALLSVQQCVASAGSNLDEVLQAVVESAVQLIPHASGAVVEMRDGDALAFRAASGASPAAFGIRLSLTDSLSGRCMAERRMLHCEDAAADPRVDKASAMRLGVRAMITVPLPHLGEMVGVLKIFSSRAGAFRSRDLLAAQLLAGPIAMALASAYEADAIAARERADRRFAATFHQAAVGLAHVAPDGAFLLVNDRFCRIVGRGRDEIMQLTFQDITHPDDLAGDLGFVRALLAGDIASYDMEKRYIRSDGTTTWANLTVSLVRDSSGEPDFFVAVIEDIGARKAAEREATHDPLTGLLNRRGLTAALGEAIAACDRDGTPLVVAMLDLDGFKSVNDAHGHAEGDLCLQLVAKALAHACGEQATVARLGGDEFVLVLPGISARAAAGLVRRIGAAIRRIGEAEGWPLRATFGTAWPRQAGSTPESLIAKADRAMYRARAARRAPKASAPPRR